MLWRPPVTTVEELCSNNPIMVDATEPAYRAAAMMKLHRIHHLPVVADGCVVGMLSARDLIGVVPETSHRKGQPARPTKSFDTCQAIHVGDVCFSERRFRAEQHRDPSGRLADGATQYPLASTGSR